TAAFQFERALDRAYMQITMGGFNYNTAICNTIKDLLEILILLLTGAQLIKKDKKSNKSKRRKK
ncbi:MAG: hypothetical protein Q4C14_06065, partial [Bacillota bacterium]|nr:hypothetical protein [Bacillota bacterium]